MRRLGACDGGGAADAAATAAGIRGSGKTDRAAGFRPERRPGFVLPCKTDRGRRDRRARGGAPVDWGLRRRGAVRLSSIMAEGGAVSLPDRPLLACEFAAVIADYVRLIVARLAKPF